MNQASYVKTVAKHLACSKARHDEFVRDLESDIAAALAAGESWEQVERRMGDPRQVASEFNADLPASERAAGKKRKRNKVIGIVVAVALVLVAVIAVAAWWAMPRYVAVGEASGHTEQQIVERSQEVVELFSDGDAQAIVALGNETMKQGLNEQMIQAAREAINGGDWGAFESFGTIYVGEFVQMGQTSNPVELVAVYEHATVTFTLAFNGDMELTGLFVK